MDEMLKRIPRQRLEAQIKLHKYANYTILRNWVGQSTTEDLYDLCDRYGIMVWDEFFQANPANGLDPLDAPLYLSNVRDKVLRFRNHPSIVIYCGRNEGAPPPEIDRGIAGIVKELDAIRYYQSSSTAGNGVVSGGGGYHWREPRLFYGNYPAFNTEVGSASIPTLEAIQSWMPAKDLFDLNFPNDDWAEHCLVGGNGNPVTKPFQTTLARRYGPYRTLADFVRKSQLADYEAFRAMYEARMSRLFHPTTAVITWMSNPAQPSFVWQIYDYSLEPFGSFFGVQKANEPVHIMMTQDDFRIMLVNHTPAALNGHEIPRPDPQSRWKRPVRRNGARSGGAGIDSCGVEAAACPRRPVGGSFCETGIARPEWQGGFRQFLLEGDRPGRSHGAGHDPRCGVGGAHCPSRCRRQMPAGRDAIQSNTERRGHGACAASQSAYQSARAAGLSIPRTMFRCFPERAGPSR